MFNKKIILFVMLLALIAGAAWGCSSSSAPNPTATPAPKVTTTPTPTSTATPTPTPTTTPTPTPTSKPSNTEIILASTTSVRDSGLMDTLLPVFQKQSGYTVKPVYVGSGAAMTMGQQGNADVLLVHSPAAEIKFMQDGYGVNRTLIMGGNDFIIVGPKSDPAGIKGTALAVDALKKITAAQVTFYSRGDNSGTDAMDKSLWAKAGITVKDGSPSNPSWYVEGGAGTGMLTLLQIASEKNGYTITDSATYLANQKILALDVMVRGDPAMKNFYHVIDVNPARHSNVNYQGAEAFRNFMIDPATQALIAQYGVAQYGSQLFVPEYGRTEAELGTQ